MLGDFKKALWVTADELRADMYTIEYKHRVLGFSFIKHISDTFTAYGAELKRHFAQGSNEYFLAVSDNGMIKVELESHEAGS